MKTIDQRKWATGLGAFFLLTCAALPSNAQIPAAVDNLPRLFIAPPPTPATPAATSTPSTQGQAARSTQPATPLPSATYVSETMGATILAKNTDYQTLFPVTVQVPAGSTISNVSWRYGVSIKPVGFEAILCYADQQPCWNLTSNATGSTAAFNGRDASKPFILHYRVQGSTPLGTPAQGEIDQLIVNYDIAVSPQ